MLARLCVLERLSARPNALHMDARRQIMSALSSIVAIDQGVLCGRNLLESSFRGGDLATPKQIKMRYLI
jgi:hypothetical protein